MLKGKVIKKTKPYSAHHPPQPITPTPHHYQPTTATTVPLSPPLSFLFPFPLLPPPSSSSSSLIVEMGRGLQGRGKEKRGRGRRKKEGKEEGEGEEKEGRWLQ